MDSTGSDYEFLFVNDGSQDTTSEQLLKIRQEDHRVKPMEFSRNFGHQVAISAGMDHARGDAVIIIDADLQDPPELIPAMINKWREGFDVVYAERTARKGETFFKKRTAALFYRTLRRMTNTESSLSVAPIILNTKHAVMAMGGFSGSENWPKQAK